MVPKISIVTLLTVGLGLLVAAAVLSVALLAFNTASRNTYDLLQDKSDLLMKVLVNRVRQHLDPAEQQTAYIAGLLERGEVLSTNFQAIRNHLIATLAATPQLYSLIYVNDDLDSVRATRWDGFIESVYEDYAGSPEVHLMMEKMQTENKGYWGPPLWVDEAQDTLINYRRPITFGYRFVGLAGAGVRVGEMSRFLESLNIHRGQNSFILYGYDRVLAHPKMVQGLKRQNANEPLPSLEDLGDPVLASIWKSQKILRKSTNGYSGSVNHVNILKMDGREYFIIYQLVQGYSNFPLIIGSYFLTKDVGEQLSRLRNTFLVGGAIFVLFILVAMILGRRLSRPIQTLAAAAEGVGKLEFHQLPVLPRSSFKELDQANTAFNAMVRTLKAFETYVPRRLVWRLIHLGAAQKMTLETREVTVMFTDIVGFTSFAEKISVEETTSFLNKHFSMITHHIEAQQGTVDKFIGDAVMAFWGAPDDQSNQADLACEAAVGIAKAIHQDNLRRISQGKKPIHLRIGLHTGKASVGNIETPSRVNYTVIGDSVNIAQRLEGLGKEWTEDEVTIIISQSTKDQLSTTYDMEPLGTRSVKGKKIPVQIYRLIPEF